MQILNRTHVIDVVYKDEDGYTHSGTLTSVLKDFVASLLVDPLPL
jgi:(-)-germacrene D synthase